MVKDIPGLDDPQRRILAASVGELRIVNLYVVNGQAVGSEKFAYKLDWLAKGARVSCRTNCTRHPHMIVLGDFNIAPEDRDVHDPEAWREQILCSTPERDALRHALARPARQFPSVRGKPQDIFRGGITGRRRSDATSVCASI